MIDNTVLIILWTTARFLTCHREIIKSLYTLSMFRTLLTMAIMPLTISVPIRNASLPVSNTLFLKKNLTQKAHTSNPFKPKDVPANLFYKSLILTKQSQVQLSNITKENKKKLESLTRTPLSGLNMLIKILKNSLDISNAPLISQRVSLRIDIPSLPISVRNSSHSVANLTRKKRYDYEDVYEWPPGDSSGYDFDANYAQEELTMWQEVGRNWQTVAIRCIFLFCFLAFIAMIIGFICYVSCLVCCDSLMRTMTPWRYVVEYLKQWYEDPMYTRAKEIAEAFGIQLDYATFQKIKETHEFGGRAGWNPANLE